MPKTVKHMQDLIVARIEDDHEKLLKQAAAIKKLLKTIKSADLLKLDPNDGYNILAETITQVGGAASSLENTLGQWYALDEMFAED